jgi:hypothetical protein
MKIFFKLSTLKIQRKCKRQIFCQNIIDNEHMSITKAIRQMQIDIIMQYHYTPKRMAKIKTVTTPNAGEEVKKLDPSAGRNVKWYSHSGK